MTLRARTPVPLNFQDNMIITMLFTDDNTPTTPPATTLKIKLKNNKTLISFNGG